MDNLSFVKRFIEGTKSGKVKWEEPRKTGVVVPLELDEGFYTQKSANIIIVMRKNDGAYALMISGADGNEIYRIDEDNLLYDAEGDHINNWTRDDVYALARLFRLAERSAKKIDSLLEELTKDLPDDDSDLPF